MKQSNPWGKGENPFSSFSNSFGFGGEGDSKKSGKSSSGSGNGFNEIGNWWRSKSKPKKALWIIIAIVVVLFLYWWFHPALNIRSQELWIFVGIFILLPSFLILRGYMTAYRTGTDKHPQDDGKAIRMKRLSWIPVVIALVGVLGALSSATFFPGNAEKYASVLETTDRDFATDIPEVDYSTIPVIDRDTASILGNRVMGSISDYVSQFEISDIYSQINYQGRPVRVSPLNYADIVKWFTNQSEGIPAYVLVDMTTQDTEIVRLENPIRISESDPFINNVDRYVQLKYPFYMFDQKSFEIDEDGNPWWICPVQDRTIGLFGGTTISRVVLCNASTGECLDLPVSEVPDWVDRVYPADLLIEQYNWSGLYLNGWWNSWLGQEGVKQTTQTGEESGYNYIVKDDAVWLYTGVTSATGDDSIIGFVLINQRTSESHFYSVAGATEESAMTSAEGQVQNLRYTSTFPLLINISGQPTYFMSLKDSGGLVKMYAMLDIQRYQNVAVGDTIEETQQNYMALLASNGVVDSTTSSSGSTEITGTISTMYQVVVDGSTRFYLTLEGDDRVFDCPVSIVGIVAYKTGDTITLQFYEGSQVCTVTAIGSGDDLQTAPADSTDTETATTDDDASQGTSEV